MAIQINKIKSTNIELTDAISSFVDSRVRALEKFVAPDDSSASVDIEVGKTTGHHNKGDIFKAEFNFQMGGKNFRVVDENTDLYAAIDKAKEEMIKTLRRNKGRQQTLFKRGGATIKRLLKRFK